MYGRDDRGRSVKLLGRREMLGLREAASVIPPLTRAKIQQASLQGACLEQVLIVILLLGMLAIGIPGAASLLAAAGPNGPPHSLRIAMAVLLGALCIGPIFALLRRRGVSMARAITAQGHCATCGYLLVGLPDAPDGCTICPECGSAWKLGPRGAADRYASNDTAR